MVVKTCSAAMPDAVAVETRPGGAAADVWLRKNIERGVADCGPDAAEAVELWLADELHFVAAGVPTVDELTPRFDEIWAAHEGDGASDVERIEALEAQLAEYQVALMELGDIIGGE